jgi:hypothetical protein
MPQPVSLILRHSWIFFIAVTIITAFVGKFRSRCYVRE